MEVIDLRNGREYVGQYVALRNRYCELLLTSAVTEEETRKWLDSGVTEVRCILEGSEVVGAAILYLNRDGEIAFLARDTNKGIGTRLLEIIEEVAKEKKLQKLWAWVLERNTIAARVFEKNGYVRKGTKERVFEGASINGIEFEKIV